MRQRQQRVPLAGGAAVGDHVGAGRERGGHSGGWVGLTDALPPLPSYMSPAPKHPPPACTCMPARPTIPVASTLLSPCRPPFHNFTDNPPPPPPQSLTRLTQALRKHSEGVPPERSARARPMVWDLSSGGCGGDECLTRLHIGGVMFCTNTPSLTRAQGITGTRHSGGAVSGEPENHLSPARGMCLFAPPPPPQGPRPRVSRTSTSCSALSCCPLCCPSATCKPCAPWQAPLGPGACCVFETMVSSEPKKGSSVTPERPRDTGYPCCRSHKVARLPIRCL